MEKENLFNENFNEYNFKKSKFLLDQRENENLVMKSIILQQKDKINNLDKDVYDLNKLSKNYKGDKIIKNLTECLENSEKEKIKLIEDFRLKENKYVEEREILNNKLEEYKQKLKNYIETNNSKIEAYNSLERLCNIQGKDIEIMKEELNLKETWALQKIHEIKVKKEKKFEQLKKKMMDKIKETHQKIEKMNLSHLDISTRLILLHNNQLIIDLDFQSNQVKHLEEKIQILKKKNFEYEKEIEILLQMESILTEKNKKNMEIIQKFTIDRTILDNNDKVLEIKNDKLVKNKTRNNFLFESNLSIFKDLNKTNYYTTKEILDKKIFNLERELAKKKESFNLLKINYDGLQEKISDIHKKQSNIISLFKLGLEELSNDQLIKSDSEIYLNIDSIKNFEFSCLSKDKQYSILLILMKYILPFFNLSEMNTYAQKIISNNIIKFKISKNKDDFLSQKFLKQNKSQSCLINSRNMDCIGKFKIKDLKLQNPKKPCIFNI